MNLITEFLRFTYLFKQACDGDRELYYKKNLSSHNI